MVDASVSGIISTPPSIRPVWHVQLAVNDVMISLDDQNDSTKLKVINVSALKIHTPIKARATVTHVMVNVKHAMDLITSTEAHAKTTHILIMASAPVIQVINTKKLRPLDSRAIILVKSAKAHLTPAQNVTHMQNCKRQHVPV